MTANEIKEALTTKYNVDPKEFSGKNKAELEAIYQTYTQAENILNTAETTEAIPTLKDTPVQTMGDQVLVPVEVIPQRYSPEWSDYVMSLFKEDELERGLPRTDALRRVAYMLFGDVRSSSCVVQSPEISNGGRATVTVDLEWTSHVHPHNTMRTSGSADCFSGNTEKAYANHATATAETRAEGRALRKALGLTKVLALEEAPQTTADEQTDQNATIPTGMLNGLGVVCQRHKIDLHKLVAYLKINVASIEMLTLKHGRDITTVLSQYQNGTPIPPEILSSNG